MSRTPPGRLGPAWAARNVADSQADLIGFLRALAAEFGDISAFDLGSARVILVNGAAPARELLTRREAQLHKPEFLKASNRGHWGDGLTTLEDEAWASHRAMLQPSFRARVVARRLAATAACTEEMLAQWTTRWPAGGRLNLAHELRVLTARMALRTVLSADVEGHAAGTVPWDQAYGEDFAGTGSGDPDAPWVMTRPRAPRRMDAVLALIDARLDGHAPPQDDVLSDLVHARTPQGQTLTRDEIVGEVIQMLYAGHLTIPGSLVHLWRDLGRHGLEEQLAREARALSPGELLQPGALGDTQALALLKESLRLHAPAPILYREVHEGFDLEGYAFEPGTAVWISPALLHKDPRYHDEPERFRPERFLPGPMQRKSMVAYFPFGAGARSCVGSHQALQQMSLIALLMARRYTLKEESAAGSGFYARPKRGDGSE